MLSRAGSLLKVDKRISGISIKPMENITNLYIEPGVYLILEEFTVDSSNIKFIELLYKKEIVLIKYTSDKQ